MPRMLRISTLPPSSASFLRSRDTCASRVLDSISSAVDFLDQRGARDDAVPSHQQRFEDQGLAATQQNLIVSYNGLISADLQFDVSERQHRRSEEPRPPQDGPHPGDEFLRLEGLAEVIVRPAVQAIDHVFLGILGRQHDDSRPFRQLAQRCDDVERVAIRQHPVDNRQIVLEVAVGANLSFHVEPAIYNSCVTY
jgi:hypothetical protein